MKDERQAVNAVISRSIATKQSVTERRKIYMENILTTENTENTKEKNLAVIARHHPPPSGKGKKMNDVWVQYKEWKKSEI
jgi:hypothetical protein